MNRLSVLGVVGALACAGCGGNASGDWVGGDLNALGIPFQSDGNNGGTFGNPSAPPKGPVLPIPTPSPFTGQFIGTYSVAATGGSGSADIVFTDVGNLTGTLHDNQSGATQSISGTISAAGYFSANSIPPGLSISGTMALGAAGLMTGSMTVTQAGGSATDSFTLTRQ